MGPFSLLRARHTPPLATASITDVLLLQLDQHHRITTAEPTSRRRRLGGKSLHSGYAPH